MKRDYARDAFLSQCTLIMKMSDQTLLQIPEMLRSLEHIKFG